MLSFPMTLLESKMKYIDLDFKVTLKYVLLQRKD